MEAIITIVGFLGAGKTTLLKRLTNWYVEEGWNPYIVLNDYENANLDVQQFLEQLDPRSIVPLNGSCICCSGIGELRYFVNMIPERAKGITLIEANGTSDSCSLLGFLGVGLNERYLPPVQVSVVDVKNWQRRGEHNELEANQIQVSSLIVLTHTEGISEERKAFVASDILRFNPSTKIINVEDVDAELLPKLTPSTNEAEEFEHLKTHWSSCSIDLPRLPHENAISHLCNALPKSILRVKGCTQVGDNEEFTFFERTPTGEINIKAMYGIPTTGAKLLTVGPGSTFEVLQNALKNGLNKATSTI